MSGSVTTDTWKYNVQALWQAAQKGVDGALVDMEYTDTRYELLTQLRTNIHVFATFKNHAQIKDMVAALTKDGKLQEWNDYKAVAIAISNNYNKTWLSAEYNNAIGMSQMAIKWNDYQKNKDVLTHIKYITQQDERVRASHAAWDGVTLPVDDPFWDEFLPPNGWECRCTTQQVVSYEDIRPTSFPSEKETPMIFRHNPGKTKEIFPLTHPFFASVKNKDQKDRLLKATSGLVYNNYDSTWTKKYHSKDGGYVVTHVDHGATELNANLKTAKILAKRGEAIELIADHPLKKSPDATRDGRLWEFKSIAGNEKTGVQNAIKRGKKQAKRILLSFSAINDINNLTLGIYNAIIINDKNKKVSAITININKTIIDISRKEIEDGSFVGKIKKAMK